MPVVDVPPWVRHDALKAIYSVDICPRGRRLATGGGDNRTRIWDARPLFTPTNAWAEAATTNQTNAPNAPAAPALDSSIFTGTLLLASLSDHYGPVNAVRFNPQNEKMLAAAGDDNNILLYELQVGTGAKEFGSNTAPNAENWRASIVCRGHLSNITDLSWSVDGRLFATCSLDNAVIVWNAKGREVARLQGHESFVKGVTWDPVGRYLATQGDDKRVIIWRTDTWKQANEVSEPFANTPPNRTHSLRLAWSPDGRFVASTNAYENLVGAHTAPIIGREKFGQQFSLVGHSAPVVTIRMNPRMRHNKGKGAVCAVAMGSQDRSISVWNLGTMRPSVYKGLFEKQVSDLAWDPSGRLLVACSLDGTVATLQFFDEEIGTPLTDAEHSTFMSSLYGSMPGAMGGKTALPESARMRVPGGGGEHAVATAREERQHHQQPSVMPQRMDRRNDGRKRIVPNAVEGGGGGGGGAMTAMPLRPPLPPPAGAAAAAGASPAPIAMVGRKRPSEGGTLQLQPAPALRVVPPTEITPQLHLQLSESGMVLEFRNQAEKCALVCRRADGTALWTDQLPNPCARAAGGSGGVWIAAGCADGTLHALLPSGRRVLPPLVLGSAPAFLSASPSSDGGAPPRLLWCGADGDLAIFNCATCRRELTARLPAIVGAEVADVRLRDAVKAEDVPVPLCVLADGRVLAYHAGLESWMLVQDHDPFSQAERRLAAFSEGGGDDDGLLGSYVAACRHWESQLAAARVLGRRQDASNAVKGLVGALVAVGDVYRLGGLVRALLRNKGVEVIGVSEGVEEDWVRKAIEPMRESASVSVQRLYEELTDEMAG
ncbi:protein HIRA [Pseudoscourfieldia marina]